MLRSFGYRIVSAVKWLFSIEISYHHFLAICSSFAFSCGLLNLIGNEPYTFQLIVVGTIGLLLSFGCTLFQLTKVGWNLLTAMIKEERSH